MLRQPIYLLLPQTQTKQDRQQRKTNKNHLNTVAQKKLHLFTPISEIQALINKL